ncbi:MAG: EamA family transporter [Pirellulales bacterium]|nr:EamA family transporter [Pirellulales bacterium]
MIQAYHDGDPPLPPTLAGEEILAESGGVPQDSTHSSPPNDLPFQENLWSARLAIFAAAILWSSSGLFAKLEVFHDWPADYRGVLLAFWRALFAGLGVLPFVRRPVWRWSILPMGLTFAAMTGSYLTALTLGTGANAIWIQNTAPGWVFLCGVLWLRQPPDRGALVTLGTAVAGIGLIVVCELTFSSTSHSHWGILCALVSAITYAGVIMQLRRLRGEDSAWLVVCNQGISVLTLLPLALWINVWPSAEQLAWLAAFGVLQMGLPYLLFSRALQKIDSQEASIINLAEPLLLPVWAYVAVGEIPAWWTITGAGIILAGLLWRYRGAWRG